MNSLVIQSQLFSNETPVGALSANDLSVPHPIPYQGSKRKLAPFILPLIVGLPVRTFFEPFAGSAAITLGAATKKVANNYQISDSLTPLVCLWKMILESPTLLADGYETIWRENEGKELTHYNDIRSQFNSDSEPAKLLYLLARCVKNAVRFNASGEFNQSPDKRRQGTRPERMRAELMKTARVLAGNTVALACNYEEAIQSVQAHDFVYMDPPWEGTSGDKDTRYHKLLNKELLVEQLELLVKKDVRFLLSFDGRLGEKTYGEGLPKELGLTRIELNAGRSSQATLSGRDDITFESLYLSPSLVKNIDRAGQMSRITNLLPIGKR